MLRDESGDDESAQARDQSVLHLRVRSFLHALVPNEVGLHQCFAVQDWHSEEIGENTDGTPKVMPHSSIG